MLLTVQFDIPNIGNTMHLDHILHRDAVAHGLSSAVMHCVLCVHSLVIPLVCNFSTHCIVTERAESLIFMMGCVGQILQQK